MYILIDLNNKEVLTFDNIESYLNKKDDNSISSYKGNTIDDIESEVSRQLFEGYRICAHCGDVMRQGYIVGDGYEYYCSDSCLHEHYTPEEWERMYTEEGDNYYTEF